MFNTEPGPNRWRAVQEPSSRRAAASSRPPPEAREVLRSATSRPRQEGLSLFSQDGGRRLRRPCAALCCG